MCVCSCYVGCWRDACILKVLADELVCLLVMDGVGVCSVDQLVCGGGGEGYEGEGNRCLLHLCTTCYC